ncbi:MAG: DUF3142 domain-containing protein [Acidobacteria bacterium]|nr:DUF3142 domain-containing protein [Acidobacteriota bacterium]
MVLCLIVLTGFVAFGWHTASHKVWQPAEVEIAFWFWQTNLPPATEVHETLQPFHTRTVFLRAGQFDLNQNRIERIRPAVGQFPSDLNLHLVYNATPALLNTFETLSETDFARAVQSTFETDCRRAQSDGAQVVGIQLDLDAPTRLLPHYGSLVRAVRSTLPHGTFFSVTGLPTWMNSPAQLRKLLNETDFWIPQCYGGKIPQKRTERIPICSPASVARAIQQARSIGHPFWAGLAAYGYALHYNSRGNLQGLYGDLDPTQIISNSNLELVNRETYSVKTSSNWRYEFRPRTDCTIDGITLYSGDSLVLEIPNSQVLRESARLVRQYAGDQLLGICLFRFPGQLDTTMLPGEELNPALSDLPSHPHFTVTMQTVGRKSVIVTVQNTGNISLLADPNALELEIAYPEGQLENLTNSDFPQFRFLHVIQMATPGPPPALVPGSKGRSNLVRLTRGILRPGETASVQIEFSNALPSLPVRLIARTSDGSRFETNTSITSTP